MPFIAKNHADLVNGFILFLLLQDYHYFRTIQDTRQKLNAATSNQVAEVAVTAGRFAGHIALRQVHDHLLQMDLMRYNKIIRTQVAKINGKVKEIKRVGFQLPISTFL